MSHIELAVDPLATHAAHKLPLSLLQSGHWLGQAVNTLGVQTGQSTNQNKKKKNAHWDVSGISQL